MLFKILTVYLFSFKLRRLHCTAKYAQRINFSKLINFSKIIAEHYLKY